MTETQDNIFLQSEADNYFQRNKNAYETPFEEDTILKMIQTNNIIPQKVLEVGACNGNRLSELNKILGCKCVAVEPSQKAIDDGQKRYAEVEFHRGLAADIPLEETFDLVIVNYVFHWIGRETLLKSVAEIDRTVSNGGYLIVGDFLPDVPTMTNYHHLDNEQAWTFKQDYSKMFVASGLYQIVSKNVTEGIDRRGLFLLKKDLNNYKRTLLTGCPSTK